MANFRTAQLSTSKQSDSNLRAVLDGHSNNGFNSISGAYKKTKMAVALKVWLMGEILAVLLTGGLIWQNGIADIKSIVALLFVILFGVTRFIDWKDKRKLKKLEYRIKEYEFDKQRDKDLSIIKK